MKHTCKKCDGSGEKECCECGNITDCNACDGEGEITCCITELADAQLPARQKHREALLELRSDAVKAQSDHRKLCELNPRASASYDIQLAETLKKINSMADSLAAAT